MSRPLSRLPAIFVPLAFAASCAGAGMAVAAPRPESPAPSSSASPRPALGARLTSCATGASETDRYAVFTGSMPSLRGARRLWMRFDLERLGTGLGSWTRLTAPTFGQWEKSRPDVSGFVYSKRVEALAAPARYRALVRFRWVDDEGHTVRRSQRVTRACVQPDPRPDLTILAVRSRRADSGPVVEITVRNTGRSDTLAPAAVGLLVGGSSQPAQTVPPLGPGATVTVTFPLPACPPGARLEAVVDPANGIAEADERDNRGVGSCGSAD